MMYLVKGTAVNRPLVTQWKGTEGESASSSPLIRYQSFSKSVPLNYELQTFLRGFCCCFLIFPFGETGRLSWDGVRCFLFLT